MISFKMSDNMKEERVKLILESLSENYISSNVSITDWCQFKNNSQ